MTKEQDKTLINLLWTAKKLEAIPSSRLHEVLNKEDIDKFNKAYAKVLNHLADHILVIDLDELEL